MPKEMYEKRAQEKMKEKAKKKKMSSEKILEDFSPKKPKVELFLSKQERKEKVMKDKHAKRIRENLEKMRKEKK